MRLVACPNCHLQYDVTRSSQTAFHCPCGETVQVVVHGPVDAPVHRCGACGAALAERALRCEYCKSEVMRDVSRMSVICPECYSRNAEDTRFCTNCGVEFKPLPLPGETVELPCPACAEPMKPRTIAGLPVQECGRCHGLWVPEDQFDALVRKAIEAQRERPSAGLSMASQATAVTIGQGIEYRKCPVCEGPMVRKNFGRRSGVIVDWCGAHGTWLDADELEHIARFILAGGLQPPHRQGAMTDGHGRKHTKEQVEALLFAERRLAEERVKQTNRRAGWGARGLEIGSLGDLLDFFLGH